MSSNSSVEVPKDGLAGLRQNFLSEISSGFIVSLLALPLSLGIAKASDFPNPMYGVLSAIIGGILVSLFAGSRLTIKGPAAGLIVICAGSVAAFGGGEMGWKMTLGAIVVASCLQILFGLLKLGKLSDFFPLSAVHGMLAAIGLIIISKQLHILLGVNPLNENGKPMVEPLELLAALPKTFASIPDHLNVVKVGLVSLALVLGIPMLPFKWLKKIPLPVIILLVAIPFAATLGLKGTKGALLKFDKPFTDLVRFNASFEGFGQMGTFIQYVILFAIIGSLESLLTAKAIDLLDPFKRKSDFNKDLIAVGSGNVLSGLLGGLPMISEVARSSSNVSNGAKTRWANFFHGLFLLLFMLLAVPVLQLIPTAALSALLIGVGIKLAHPKEFKHAFQIGKEQLLVFVVTVVFTLAVDLLVGIAAGILTEFVVNLVNGKPFKRSFKASVEMVDLNDNTILIRLNEAAVFSNFMGIKKQLYAVEGGKLIQIDCSNCNLLDHSAMENIHLFEHDYAHTGGRVELIGLEKHMSLSNHNLSAKKLK